MMQQSLRAAPSMKKRAKSVYSQRNLGTIKERKKEKKQEAESASEQIIMRILRMRCDIFCALFLRRTLLTAPTPAGPGRRSSSRSSCRSWPRCRRSTRRTRARSRSASSSASRTATLSRPFPRSPRIDDRARPPAWTFLLLSPTASLRTPPHIGYRLMLCPVLVSRHVQLLYPFFAR